MARFVQRSGIWFSLWYLTVVLCYAAVYMQPKRVAIYARVSTDDQHVDLQIAELTTYVKQRGYSLYQMYEDTISGTTRSRPNLDLLLVDAKHRKFDVVLVWKFDRFARSLKMLVDSLELFQQLGIDFISYKESIDTTTSMGRLIFHINSAYAEFERELIRDRVLSGIRAKRAKTNNQWGRKALAQDVQESIHQMIQAGSSIRKTAQVLHLSTRTVRKYKLSLSISG